MGEGAEPVVRKVIKKHAAGHHGGSWKVAYADFMTAMMAFFLVMWLVVTMLSMEQRAGIAEYFKIKPIQVYNSEATVRARAPGKPGQASAPNSVSSQPQSVAVEESDLQKPADVKEKLKDMFANKLQDMKDQVQMSIVDEGLRIDIMDSEGAPLFQLGSSSFNPRLVNALSEINNVLSRIGNKVSIEGHTDAARYESGHYTNWELSVDRANEARRQLEKDGFDANRLEMVAGYAAKKPLFKDNPKDPRNRRISVIIHYPVPRHMIYSETASVSSAPAAGTPASNGAR